MCGIAGRYHPDGLAPVPSWRAEAGALLAHRGPDGAGEFADTWCELVHRRLALQDLTSTGAQPMTNEDGSIVVVFNGEIYNHRELRRELRNRGHLFRGTSDTEVLVHLYEEAGTDLLQRLRGIYAFALYDARMRRLLLARDRFGVKPLYYTGPGVDGEWVFASEMKAILARPGFTGRLDRQACYDFLGLGFVPEPMTGFTNIATLRPGTFLLVDGRGARLGTHARATPEPDGGRELEATRDDFAERLLESVRAQSVADVPVAALLSGGIDSSLVVAAHARATGTPPHTFSVAFPDAQYDESAAARAVAAHCHTDHHTVDAREYVGSADETLALLRHFDQPFADPSCFATHWVSRAIRDHGIVCALSGDGGDEAFGGYPRFWQAPRILQYAHAPQWMLAAGVFGGSALQHLTADTGRRVAKASRLASASRGASSQLLAGFSLYLSEEQKAELVAPEARAGLRASHRLFDGHQPPGTDDVEELSRRLTDTTFRVTLPGDMLHKVDMMSMRAGVEIRVPLLDDAVVDLGLHLPHRLKTDGHRGKLVLRALAEAWLPAEVARLPKRGFGVPLDLLATDAFTEALGDHLTGPASRTRVVASTALVGDWLDRFAHRSEGRDRGSLSRGGLHQRLLSLLALELWMRDHHLTW